MSVVFPAPFSPRSAWTSPRRRSRSTWSLATTPGKRFVIPRSSRTTPWGSVTSASYSGKTEGRDGARPSGTSVNQVLLRGRYELPARQQLLQLLARHGVLRRNRLRQQLGEPAVAHAAV